MWSGWPYAVGSDMSRAMPPARGGRSSPSCHRVASVSLPVPSVRSTSSPMTSDIDSLIAPDWNQYMRPEVCCVTPCPSSWATTSSATRVALAVDHLVAGPCGVVEGTAGGRAVSRGRAQPAAVAAVVADEVGQIDAQAGREPVGGRAGVVERLVGVGDADRPLALDAVVAPGLAHVGVGRDVGAVADDPVESVRDLVHLQRHGSRHRVDEHQLAHVQPRGRGHLDPPHGMGPGEFRPAAPGWRRTANDRVGSRAGCGRAGGGLALSPRVRSAQPFRPYVRTLPRRRPPSPRPRRKAARRRATR